MSHRPTSAVAPPSAADAGNDSGGAGAGQDLYPGVAAIVARIPLDVAGRELAGSFRAEIGAFERLPESSQADVAEGVERNLRRWARWMQSGAAPPDSDFDPLREWARARATEGVRLEDLLRAFGVGRRAGWELLRRHAREDEAAALLDAAGLLMQYVERVSAVVTDTYLAEREALVSEEERRTRNLLDLLCGGEPLAARDRELAERVGVPVEPSYAPFAIVMPGRPPRQHAALAARLRRRGWRLSVTDGDRVVGITWSALDLSDLDEGTDVILVVGDAAPRRRLVEARENVLLLVECGRRAGLRGRLRAEDHMPEILIGRSPEAAAALRDRVLGPLSDPDHDDLLRTVCAFVSHDHDRAATSAALHIHRNTLAYRLRRVEEVAGLDLGSARDLACVYLALAVEPTGPSA